MRRSPALSKLQSVSIDHLNAAQAVLDAAVKWASDDDQDVRDKVLDLHSAVDRYIEALEVVKMLNAESRPQ